MGQFERIKYPDGQISAKYKGIGNVSFGFEQRLNPFIVSERINSYEDLFFVRSIADVLKHRSYGTGGYKLFIPCLFGQRSDRRFDENQSFDLDLIARTINACGFGQVEILDPHSDVALALIDHSVKRSSLEYVRQAFIDILIRTGITDKENSNILLIAPDAGAYKKVFEYGQKLKLPVMGAMKHRDNQGEIDLIFSHDVEGKDCFIVDDLCDGGYTFIKLAEKLREHRAKSVYLYVTHGLFSQGFVELRKVITHIYCTNSVKDIVMDKYLDPSKDNETQVKDFITQYKVI